MEEAIAEVEEENTHEQPDLKKLENPFVIIHEKEEDKAVVWGE